MPLTTESAAWALHDFRKCWTFIAAGRSPTVNARVAGRFHRLAAYKLHPRAARVSATDPPSRHSPREQLDPKPGKPTSAIGAGAMGAPLMFAVGLAVLGYFGWTSPESAKHDEAVRLEATAPSNGRKPMGPCRNGSRNTTKPSAQIHHPRPLREPRRDKGWAG